MFDIKDERNLTMLTDFYELTMANGYMVKGIGEKEVVFDMFFRKIPDNGGYAIAAGLQQLIEYIKNLSFSKEDVNFLRSKHMFSEEFLSYLESFKFTCDIWAIKEGTPVFPKEPIVVVKGPAMQAQLIETMVLLTINHQTLIATKANRISRAAQGRPVMEFGSRRAQSYDAAMLGARSAFIGGCSSTACVIADQYYSIPAVGTMAHSWVQIFDDEYEAFKAYAETYPESCTLLVDTYDVLKSGMPNAIRVFDEVLKPMGIHPAGVRIDSGDIAYLSKKMRKMLDDAGYPECKIVASNALDEYIIRDLILQGAQVDSFGVGENLITSRSEPVFGGVYKLSAVEQDGIMTPKIKISESSEKITTPGFKNLYRLFDKKTDKAIADYICLREEEINEDEPLVIFDPDAVWKHKKLTDYKAECLLERICDRGKIVYTSPSLKDIREFCRQQVSLMWDELLRFENPHRYYVDLSDKLWNLKHTLLEENSYK